MSMMDRVLEGGVLILCSWLRGSWFVVLKKTLKKTKAKNGKL